MIREYGDFIQDIVSAFEECLSFTMGMVYEEFKADTKTYKAIIRHLEVAGEAAKKIPDEVKQRNPDIPWKSMTGMRDKLIHEYFGVDARIVWNTVRENIPGTLPHIRRLLTDYESQI